MIDSSKIDQRLYNLYLHDLQEIREVDFSADRPHLSCEDVLDAHYLIGDHFLRLGEKMGGFGPKDTGLLSSAVARQVSSAGGKYVYSDLWDIAGSLLFGLINNHPFHDANKRTAFLSCVFFMLEHNYVPRVSVEEIENFTVEVAEFNAKTGRHMEVEEISSKLKRMFRPRDNRIAYTVTFRELRRLLEDHGCSLRNPEGTYIDVYKGETKVATIGYPGDSREVSRQDISTVRKSTGLTAENGYDAQVFFKGEDPLNVLIGEYEETLRRLADR